MNRFSSHCQSARHSSESIRDTAIEVKTPPLRKIGKNGYLQCIALSKRPDFIPNMNDTYVINVDGNDDKPVPAIDRVLSSF